MKIEISRGCLDGKPYFKAQIVRGAKILRSFTENQLDGLSKMLTRTSSRDFSGIFSEPDFKKNINNPIAIDDPIDLNTTIELRFNGRNKMFVFTDPIDLHNDSIESLQEVLKCRVEAVREWVRECEANQNETFEINL